LSTSQYPQIVKLIYTVLLFIVILPFIKRSSTISYNSVVINLPAKPTIMSNYVIPSADAHPISLNQAIAMTTLYRENRETILLPEYRGKNILCLNETFNKDAIQSILNQTDCAGIRVYYGMSDDLQVHAIFVGVNTNGEDIVSISKNYSDDGDGEIMEEGQRCPTYCPPASLLNGF